MIPFYARTQSSCTLPSGKGLRIMRAMQEQKQYSRQRRLREPVRRTPLPRLTRHRALDVRHESEQASLRRSSPPPLTPLRLRLPRRWRTTASWTTSRRRRTGTAHRRSPTPGATSATQSPARTPRRNSTAVCPRSCHSPIPSLSLPDESRRELLRSTPRPRHHPHHQPQPTFWSICLPRGTTN